MVNSFQFASLPKVFFGPGTVKNLPRLITSFAQPVLLLTGKSSFIHGETGKDILNLFVSNKIQYRHESILKEPSPVCIDTIVERYKDELPGLVVAAGGGSVLDAGKAVSAMFCSEGSVRNYLEGVGNKLPDGKKIPFIAIPTTSGTGSEATKNAVISEVGERGFKKSLRHDNFVPDIALIDPSLTLSCPPAITAASGMDCFTQLTEAFLSDKASAWTDAFAREGMKAVRNSLERAVKDGSDLEARTGMSYAAMNSGICLANAGLGTVHGFASSVGGKVNIPHGVLCGTLMASANRITLEELIALSKNDPQKAYPALTKYNELGILFSKNKKNGKYGYAYAFIDFLYELTEKLQLPRLNKFEIKPEDFDFIAEKTGNKNNPVNLSKENLMKILYENWEDN